MTTQKSPTVNPSKRESNESPTDCLESILEEALKTPFEIRCDKALMQQHRKKLMQRLENAIETRVELTVRKKLQIFLKPTESFSPNNSLLVSVEKPPAYF